MSWLQEKTEIQKEINTLHLGNKNSRNRSQEEFFWGKKRPKKSVPPSSSRWARGQARGGRKEVEEGEEGRRDEEEREGGREKAGRICGDCRGAWNRCRII